MVKREKESLHRTKLKNERMMRLKAKHKQSQKKRANEELFHLIKVDTIDQLSGNEKLNTLTQLSHLVISFPEANYDKIELMMLFLRDNNIKIIMKTIKMLTNLFMDLLPSYRIRQDEEGEGKKSLSKEVEHLKRYEGTLLTQYGNFIDSVALLDKNFSQKGSMQTIHRFCVDIIAQLFEKFHYFNLNDKLYKVLVERLSDSNEEVRKICFESLYKVLSIADNSSNNLELKLSIIKLISHYIYIRPHDKFNANVLELFIAHRIDFPEIKKENVGDMSDIKTNKVNKQSNDMVTTKQQEKNLKKENKKLMAEKNKILKNLKRDMAEVENVQNSRLIYNMNLKMLKKILLVYFEILKNKRDSQLMEGVLKGIGAMCENINVEILLDLQKCIHGYVDYVLSSTNIKAAYTITALKSCMNITDKLTKDIISIEDSNLINSTYHLLSRLHEVKLTKDEIFTVLELIDNLLLKNRQFSLNITSSYVKRLSIFVSKSKHLEEKAIASFLLVIKRILQKYPSTNGLLDEEETDGFNDKIVKDPSLCNGKLTNIIKEMSIVKESHSNSKLIRQLVEYILKGEKTNAVLGSLNFFEVLIN